MQALDTTIVNTALPSMARSLHDAPLAMQPIVVAYTLTMAMLMPASGWLADRFGTRRVFFGAILAVRRSARCSARTRIRSASSCVARAAGRRRLDAAAGRTARRAAQRFRRAYVSGARDDFGRAGLIGPLLGPTLGGWLVQTITWHWIFLINVPIGAVGSLRGAALSCRSHGESRGAAVRLRRLRLAVAVHGRVFAGARCPVRRRIARAGRRPLRARGREALAYIPHARRRRNPLFHLALFSEPNFTSG